MKIIQTLLFTIFFISTSAFSITVGSGFSYQGQLTDGGSPANGNYDIIIDAYKLSSGGSVLATQSFIAVTVSNGLINIPQVDFGDALYNGDEVWLEVSVRATGGGAFIPLFPRQRMAAVPYAVQAEFLASNGASFGDVLFHNGMNWIAEPFNTLSKWIVSSVNDNMRTNGMVGIKTDPTDTLHIKAPIGGENPFRVQVGSSTKLRVNNATGGVSIGANATPPVNGLYVAGRTTHANDVQVNADIKQPLGSYGLVKYLIEGRCSGAVSNITRQINNVNSSPITITDVPSINHACKINLPTGSTDYFVIASVRSQFNGDGRVINCFSNASQVQCESRGLGGSLQPSSFTIAIF